MSQALNLNLNQTKLPTTLPPPNERNHSLFPLGQIVATNGVHQHLVANSIDPSPYIQRHHCGLWGDVPPEDAQENDFSVGLNLWCQWPACPCLPKLFTPAPTRVR